MFFCSVLFCLRFLDAVYFLLCITFGHIVRRFVITSTCSPVCCQRILLQQHSYFILWWLPLRAPSWSSGSVLDHRSLPPVFESRRGHIWRLFHFWLRLITFGGRSAHLAYHVHKSGRKTSIIIMICACLRLTRISYWMFKTTFCYLFLTFESR